MGLRCGMAVVGIGEGFYSVTLENGWQWNFIDIYHSAISLCVGAWKNDRVSIILLDQGSHITPFYADLTSTEHLGGSK